MKLVFGGTFDPIHLGHIRMANEVCDLMGVDFVSLMPCFEAVHKDQVGASAKHRVAMMELALRHETKLKIDKREISRASMSYTYDSLVELRSELGNYPLSLLMGSDTATKLHSWRFINKFPALTNVCVFLRPDSVDEKSGRIAMIDDKLKALGWLSTNSVDEFKSSEYGKSLFLKLSQIDISSTDIRNKVYQNKSIEGLVADEVAAYICNNKLYRNLVSYRS